MSVVWSTEAEILDWIDPEWRDRWQGDADMAAEHYKRYAQTEWAQAKRELAK